MKQINILTHLEPVEVSKKINKNMPTKKFINAILKKRVMFLSHFLENV